MSRRIFGGGFKHGELQFYPNHLDGQGAGTTLHRHAFPHVSLFYPGEPFWLRAIKATFRFFGVYHWLGFAEYEVFAVNSNGEEVFMPMDDWGFVYIEAGIPHRVRMTRGSRGGFVCLFSRIGPNGELRADPKAGVEEV